ncbi:hypothetical protein [Nocardia terpenica]|uniref:hypothetical protein n=1 Tax=Nocardia terpenica TaxID=455432 RepID=UPI0012E86517|nr:hypothetical protein [Nocardia terpenica]NQE91213.1 hypothetical protein [Nocardia terpenica]
MYIDMDPLPRAAVAEWIDARSQEQLHTYGGPAWLLSVAQLDDGGSVVSLLVSHTLADALGLFAAVRSAINKNVQQVGNCSRSPNETLYREVRDAALRLASIVPTVPAIIRYMKSIAHDPFTGTSAAGIVSSIDAQEFPIELPMAIAVVSAADWRRTVQVHNGTGSALAVAIMADLATRLGRTDADGLAWIAMPVSTRSLDSSSDLRGNALDTISIQLNRKAGPGSTLAAVRAEIKSKLKSRAADERVRSQILSLLVSLPRSMVARLLSRRRFNAIITGCSYVYNSDTVLRCIDGDEAASFFVGLVEQDLRLVSRVCSIGGILHGTILESEDTVWLQIHGFHPVNPMDSIGLRSMIGQILADHGLTATFL